MRSLNEAILHPAADDATISELMEEMSTHFKVPSDVCTLFSTLLHCSHPGVTNARLLREQDQSIIDPMTSLATMPKQVLCLILGTAQTHHQFPDSQAQVGDAHTPDPADTASADKNLFVMRRGGVQSEKAEYLSQPRSPDLADNNYFLPATFDVHKYGSPFRDEFALRLLIQNELYQVPPHAAS